MRYSTFYLNRRRAGDFVILDNGAAEGVDFSDPKRLTKLASDIEANEIIVPDVMGDTVGTISRAKGFAPYAAPEYKYMAVLQGSTQQEVLRCLGFFDTAPDMQYITCIGIPRHLNDIHRTFRLELAEFLIANAFHTRFQFHFLGASSWIREIAALTAIVEGYETANWDSVGFRGHDTSLPIYMGLAEKLVTTDTYTPRPKTFFETVSVTDKARECVRSNIDTYLVWANSPRVSNDHST